MLSAQLSDNKQVQFCFFLKKQNPQSSNYLNLYRLEPSYHKTFVDITLECFYWRLKEGKKRNKSVLFIETKTLSCALFLAIIFTKLLIFMS